MLILYLIFPRKGKKEADCLRALDLQRALFLGEAVDLSWEEYLWLLRARKTQQAAKTIEELTCDENDPSFETKENSDK